LARRFSSTRIVCKLAPSSNFIDDVCQAYAGAIVLLDVTFLRNPFPLREFNAPYEADVPVIYGLLESFEIILHELTAVNASSWHSRLGDHGVQSRLAVTQRLVQDLSDSSQAHRFVSIPATA